MTERDDLYAEWEIIRLHVGWFYRAEIKDPPDSLSELAKEAGCSKAEVAAGIAEAKAQLAKTYGEFDNDD